MEYVMLSNKIEMPSWGMVSFRCRPTNASGA